MNTGSVWIIDSDIDDQEMVREVWKELHLPNELAFFETAEEAMGHLANIPTAPFIIISELRLPKTNGFELREKMLATHSPKFKSVPFIIWTSHASEEYIIRAYDLSVHGFFIKDPRFEELKVTFLNIINYWLRCKIPPKGEK
ncbi:response regulator [Niastella sp. OAS944]|uniref:response regulator n=1 Tax=Niastella sp. OAS944 TaxID=2664089 RepID=UPI00346AD1E3|nr:DNA-binding NarL/FixJ family response regulator [Chitinophagaceae bacterium OAS944]